MEFLPPALIVAGSTFVFTVLITIAHFVFLVREASNRRQLPPMRIILPPQVRIDYSMLPLTTRYTIGAGLHGLSVCGGIVVADLLAIAMPVGWLILLYWLPWAVGGGAIIALHRWRAAIDAHLFGAAAAGELAARISEDWHGATEPRSPEDARSSGRSSSAGK